VPHCCQINGNCFSALGHLQQPGFISTRSL
jgi:hypothetical protein